MGLNDMSAALTDVLLRHSNWLFGDMPDSSRLIYSQLLPQVQEQFAGQNFSGAPLSEADLSDAKLQGTFFMNTGLVDVNFSRADLTAANFDGSQLRRANFEGAILAGATLTFTNFGGANFNRAELAGANMIGALLAWVDEDGHVITAYGFENAGCVGTIAPLKYDGQQVHDMTRGIIPLDVAEQVADAHNEQVDTMLWVRGYQEAQAAQTGAAGSDENLRPDEGLRR